MSSQIFFSSIFFFFLCTKKSKKKIFFNLPKKSKFKFFGNFFLGKNFSAPPLPPHCGVAVGGQFKITSGGAVQNAKWGGHFSKKAKSGGALKKVPPHCPPQNIHLPPPHGGGANKIAIF